MVMNLIKVPLDVLKLDLNISWMFEKKIGSPGWLKKYLTLLDFWILNFKFFLDVFKQLKKYS